VDRADGNTINLPQNIQSNQPSGNGTGISQWGNLLREQVIAETFPDVSPPPEQPEALDLTPLLESSDVRIRRVAQCIRDLKSNDEDVRYQGAQCISQHSYRAVNASRHHRRPPLPIHIYEIMIRALSIIRTDDTANILCPVAVAYGNFAEANILHPDANEAMVPRLREMATNQRWTVRVFSMSAFGYIIQSDISQTTKEEIVYFLLSRLQEPDDNVHYWVDSSLRECLESNIREDLKQLIRDVLSGRTPAPIYT
jgi:hypothetical protein